jgi:hypothetical protein
MRSVPRQEGAHRQRALLNAKKVCNSTHVRPVTIAARLPPHPRHLQRLRTPHWLHLQYVRPRPRLPARTRSYSAVLHRRVAMELRLKRAQHRNTALQLSREFRGLHDLQKADCTSEGVSGKRVVGGEGWVCRGLWDADALCGGGLVPVQALILPVAIVPH